MNDQQLLARYAADRSPDAFAAIVHANIDLVYAAARRQLSDLHLAEDVTQGVFLLLSQKPHTIKGPLAGWLIKATYYCCRDARKLAARRAHHERQAMTMRPILDPGSCAAPPAWETYAPLLDDALLHLRAKDRDALTLRYLKGFSLQEVGVLLGVSEEAARKRVDRALEHLKARMAVKASIPSASVFTAAMLALPVHGTPAGLADLITKSAAAKSGLALAIAHAGAKGMGWTQINWPVGIAAAALVLSGGVGAGIFLHGPTRPDSAPLVLASAPIPETAPVVAIPSNPNEEEARVPGEIQLTRWDVLLEASELPALQKIAAPLSSGSKLYRAYRCNGVDLRRTIRAAIDAGTLVRGSDEMEIANDWMKHGTLQFFNPPYFQHLDDPTTPMMLLGGSMLQNDSFVRVDADRVHIKLDHPDFKVSIAKLAGNTQWIAAPGQALRYEGDVSPGEAVVFLGEMPVIEGRAFLHVIAWESFQANAQQMEFAPEERDARWWCENGPAQLRHWADVARLWTAQTPAHPATPPNAEIKLEDGKVLHLEALCRPSKWPNCWWDTLGNPVKSQNKIITFAGEPPEGLFAYVTISGGAPDEHHRRNPSYDYQESGAYEESGCEAVEDDNGTIAVGAAVGPWTKLATLALNKPQTINGVRYRIRKPMSFGDTDFLVEFSRSGILANDDLLLPTTAEGKAASTSAEPTVIFQHNTEEQVKNEQPNYHGVALSKVVRYDLMQRHRAWVSFANVAVEPKSPPPMTATAEDAGIAEKIAARRAWELTNQSLEEKRKSWAAISRNRKEVFGALRILVDAVRAGDEKTVRSLLTSETSEGQQLVDPTAHFLVAADALRRAANGKLGRELTDEERLHLGADAHLMNDLEQELFVSPWSGDREAHSPDDHYVLRRNDADDYALAIDELSKMPDAAAYLREQTALADRVRTAVQAMPTLTYPQLQVLLKPAAATQKQSGPR